MLDSIQIHKRSPQYYNTLVVGGGGGCKPVRCQALPEGNAPICAADQDPGVWHSFGFCAHTHISIQAKAQQ